MRASLRSAAVLVAALAGLSAAAPAAPPALTLVVCAPGYPGSTAEAQPAMDALAAAVAAAAGWKAGDLQAAYFEREDAGLERLSSSDAAMLLAPLPFWLKHRSALKLDAFMQAVEESGEAAEAWTLVAAAGQVARAADLSGYELLSIAGYAPRFVRGPVLGSWGELPRDARISFSSAVLSGLRRASTGAKVAMVLDRAQAAAVPSLPFAARLQLVATSPRLPVSVLSAVAGRLPAARRASLAKALASLRRTPAGSDALAGVRLSRFVPADHTELARTREAYDRMTE